MDGGSETSGESRALRLATEIAIGVVALTLLVASLLPAASGLGVAPLVSAVLLVAFAVIWFHVVPEGLFDRWRLSFGAIAVQATTTYLLINTGGLGSDFFVYHLVPMIAAALAAGAAATAVMAAAAFLGLVLVALFDVIKGADRLAVFDLSMLRSLELIAIGLVATGIASAVSATRQMLKLQNDTLHSQNAELEAARSALSTFARLRDRGEISRMLLATARDQVAGISVAWLPLVRGTGFEGLVVGMDGVTRPYDAAGDPASAGPRVEAIRSRSTVMIEDALNTAQPIRPDLVSAYRLRGVLTCPLVAGDEVIGVVTFGRQIPGWRDREVRLLEIIVGAAAPAIATAAAFEELHQEKEDATKLAITDELTGLYNRHFLQQQLEALLARSARHGGTFAFVAIDLDRLKSINDTLGHQAGDAALKAFGELLRAQLRGEDFAVRIGGDEFVALLPDTDAIGGLRTIERLRAEIRRLDIEGRRLSFSAGVTAWRPGRDADAMFAAADALLYEVKRDGGGAVKAELPT